MDGAMIVALLEPRAQRIGIRTDGMTPDVFGMIEAAHATAGVPSGAVVVLRMLYAGGVDTPDRAGRAWAQDFATEHAGARRSTRYWRISGPRAKEVFPRVVDSAFYELVSPALCQSCLGRGYHARGELLVQCGKCKGDGSGAPMERHLRQIAGVSRQEWHGRWKIVHDDLVHAMDRRLTRYLSDMRKKAR